VNGDDMTASVPWAELAETHSAIVVFAGDRAYKLKKPATFDFLDFSTRELREAAVHREVELNRRIAPDVYLGVADVLDVDGSVCDHLVVMRRLPSDRRLSTLITTGTVVEDDLRALARIISVFHASAPRTAATAAQGSPERIAAKLALDLGELSHFGGSIFDPAALEEASARATTYVRGRARLFETRVAEGWVCDGHGDLLADDVFCLADGPRVLDCIDFSDELRYGDVLADVAFLAMDLERLGAPGLARWFIRLYEEFSGEHHPASLVDYYIAFRALIRAKVAALRVEQGDDRARDTANQLLDLALTHLRGGRVALVLVGGAPGTGKTTVADALGARCEWAVERSDVVRKELAGLDPRASAPAEVGQGLYSPETTSRTYEELLTRARVALELGQSIVLDASWSDGEFRRDAARLAAATSSDLIELRCDVDPSIADARIERRRAEGRDASDADSGVAAVLRSVADPWPEAMTIDTSGTPAATFEQAWSATRAVPFRGAPPRGTDPVPG
jgi:aminoglycoside phosphotransferase family enzyme/predicted kinase